MSIFTSELYLNNVIFALIIIFSFLVFRNVVARYIVKILRKISEKYKFKGIVLMVDSLENPLKSFFLYMGMYFALSVLPLYPTIELFIDKVFRTCIILTITQCLLNIVSSYSVLLSDNMSFKEEKPLISKTLFPLLSKILKVLIIILALVAIASEFNFKQFGSVLAGVGIGGAAIALASQDLIKNFFGGFIVITDKSFHVGDYITIESTEGTVEELGLRSTRIRTMGQELVVVPNSKFTSGAVINYSRRNTRRASFKVGVTYGTSSEKLKIIIDRIKNMLDSHPLVKRDSSVVKFDNFSPSSLEIGIQYMANTGGYVDFLSIKDDVNFRIMNLFEEEGVSFAFPSMSIYMKNDM